MSKHIHLPCSPEVWLRPSPMCSEIGSGICGIVALVLQASSRSQANLSSCRSHLCPRSWAGDQHPIYFFEMDFSMNNLWGCRLNTLREDLALAVTEKKFLSSYFWFSCLSDMSLSWFRLLMWQKNLPFFFSLGERVVMFLTAHRRIWQDKQLGTVMCWVRWTGRRGQFCLGPMLLYWLPAACRVAPWQFGAACSNCTTAALRGSTCAFTLETLQHVAAATVCPGLCSSTGYLGEAEDNKH